MMSININSNLTSYIDSIGNRTHGLQQRWLEILSGHHLLVSLLPP